MKEITLFPLPLPRKSKVKSLKMRAKDYTPKQGIIPDLAGQICPLA